MQLYSAALFALLTTAQTASAWQVIAYQGTDHCSNRVANRVLRGGKDQNRCYTFGESMPGVTCKHYVYDGATSQGCHGNLHANTIRIGTGENCWFYSTPHCAGGDRAYYKSVNKCVNEAGPENIGSEIKSFQCS